jgi:hypothetical protein
MEGLMNAMQSPDQQDAGQLASGLGAEQIAMYKKSVQVGQNLLYNKAVFDKMMEGTQQAGPTRILAGTIVKILSKIEEQVGQLDLQVLLAVGISLLQDVAGAMQETGRVQINAETAQEALGMAVSMWLEVNGNRVPPDQLQEAAQAFGGQMGPSPQDGQAMGGM